MFPGNLDGTELCTENAETNASDVYHELCAFLSFSFGDGP